MLTFALVDADFNVTNTVADHTVPTQCHTALLIHLEVMVTSYPKPWG